MQCVRPAARAGEDDVQANLDACKGRVPKQEEECVGKDVGVVRACRRFPSNEELFRNLMIF